MLSPQRQRVLRERVERLRLFDPKEYLSLNDDVSSASDPIQHYVDFGIWEQRPFRSKDRFVNLLGSIVPEPDPSSPPLTIEATANTLAHIHQLDVGVFVSSEGNFFMKEIAEQMVLGLKQLGVRATLLDEHADIEKRPTTCIFVAPHEFFTLGRGKAWVREDILASGFMYSTEQVQTPWFRAGLPFILASRGVIDLNFQTQSFFREAGLPSLFYFPGYDFTAASKSNTVPDHPLVRALPKTVVSYDESTDIWAERPLDLAFVGAESPLREEFLAQSAAYFSSLSCFIYYVRARRLPLVVEDQDTRPALNQFIGRRSKIVLNIHQTEVGYFEWHRMVMQGVWQKALVISNPCLPHPLFKPGLHYLEEIPRRIPKLIQWLLETPRGRLTAERIRHEAFAALVEQASMRKMSLLLSDFLLSNSPSARNP